MTPLTDIYIFSWSDHAPIYLELGIIKYKKPVEIWRLNDNLIKNKECENYIREAIREFLQIHKTDNTSIPMQW